MNALDRLLNFELPVVVAIDGTAASGKGTLAKLLSERFKLEYCQTSLVYRQLAYEALKKNIDIENNLAAIVNLSTGPLNIASDAQLLYTPDVTHAASVIATIPQVRENLTKGIKKLLKDSPRIVMEGRDIGTQIAPDAEIKLFITAPLDVRAQRRYEQMNKSGHSVSVEDIKKDIEQRDIRDMNRAAAPLTKTPDAIEIDTSIGNPQEIIDWLLEHLKRS